MPRPLLPTATAVLLWLALLAPPQLAGQVDVTLTGVGENVVVNGVYVGHYTLATPGTPSLDVYCVDFLNSVGIGNQWDAHFSGLGGALGNTRHGEAARTLYQKAAWLTTQFGMHVKQEWGAIHAAIWYTMAPNPEAITKLKQSNWYQWQKGSTTVQHWIDMANANYASLDPSRFVVITDVNAVGQALGGKQEYVAVVAVPEPATMLLLGSGLAGLAGAARARRRRRDGLGGLPDEVG